MNTTPRVSNNKFKLYKILQLGVYMSKLQYFANNEKT